MILERAYASARRLINQHSDEANIIEDEDIVPVQEVDEITRNIVIGDKKFCNTMRVQYGEAFQPEFNQS